MFTPQPFHEAYLPEEDGHKVYYAQYGNPEGPAIISCHGGPGGNSKPKHAASFDLEQYHVILFDQRGCGQSESAGEIRANTTQDLVADMERIRNELGIKRWFVSGSSWGSTLALVYAQTHPEYVRGLLLSALFLADARSDQWAFTDPDGVARLFPDGRAHLENNLSSLGISTDEDTIYASLLNKLQNGPAKEQRQVAALVSSWEVNLLAPHIDIQYTREEEVDEVALARVSVFLHYQANQYFLSEAQILQNIDSMKELPVCLVHGRYDILCPLEAAWKIHRELPNSQFIALPESAHVIKGDGALARYYAFAHFLKTLDF